jgi:serpin B
MMGLTAMHKILPVCLLAMGSTCHKPTPSQDNSPVQPQIESSVTDAQNQFAFRLFAETLKEHPDPGNVLISPISIYLDLSMAYNGTAGTTRSAMREALGLKEIDDPTLNAHSLALLQELTRNPDGISLDVANSIWYRDHGITPLDSFLQINKQYYQALIKGTDFGPATVGQVNDWVNEKTHGKIPTILERISPEDFMYLINAVYFKGAWKNSFDSTRTEDRAFESPDGTVQTPFMTSNDRRNYLGNDSLQMVELPYGSGEFSMYVLLPAAKTDMEKFMAGLQEKTISGWIAAMDSVKIRLLLPKWKYRYEISDLKPALSALGMGVAFTKQADFSRMYPADAGAYISKALHKTYIEVNESGTEAAAVTSIGVSVTSAPINPPPLMEVNRPFLYLIMDKSSGVVVFMGMVTDPTTE